MLQSADRARLLTASIVGWCALWYVAYAWTAIARLDLVRRPLPLALAIVLLAALWMIAQRRPMPATLVFVTILPLFGNHPGGRFMELINLPLAATAAGMARQSLRWARPVPSGPIWIAAGLYLASAVIAIVPSVPGMLVKAAQLNHWPTALMEALTASEENPFYALSSLVGVTLAIAWAAALAWRAQQFVRLAVPALVYTLFVIVGIGILDYHKVIDVTRYFYLVDPRKPDLLGFQSLFWNPGWFAWYFVLVFGLALGYLWHARPRERLVVGTLLALSYLYFFRNPQRGGLIALHVCLACAGLILFATNRRPSLRRLLPAAAIGLLATVVGAYLFGLIPQELGSSLFRLIETPEDATTSNSVRARLWSVSFDMWRDAPVFGIGEGSFAWRFEDYAPRGTARYSPVHGDAHNTWLQILATRGLFGVASFLFLIWATGRALSGSWRRADADRGLAIGVGLSLIGFLVYSIVQGMFYLQSIQVLFWFLVAAASALAGAQESAARPGLRRPLVAAALAVAVVVQGLVVSPLLTRASDAIARQPQGAYDVESDTVEARRWRWTTGDATLCLVPQGPRMQVGLATRDGRLDEYPRTIRLSINGRVVDTVRVPGPDRITRVVTLPGPAEPGASTTTFGECTGQPGEVRLTVEVDRRWSPLAAGQGGDPRTFGVQVFEPEYLQNP